MEKQTISKKLQNEIQNALYDDKILKPWSLKNFDVNTIYLDSTLDDVINYWNQDARFREGFYVDKVNNTVNIPNFFVKIDGVYKDKKKYKRLIQQLSTGVVYKNTPTKFETNTYNTIPKDLVQKLLGKIRNESKITIEDIKNISSYKNPLLNLNTYILNYVIKKLNEFIKINKKYYDIENLLNQLANFDENLYKELNNWDFGFYIPKLTIINENEKNLSLQFLEFVEFLNFLGFDIIFFSERGEDFPKIENHYQFLNTFVLDCFEKSKTESDVLKQIKTKKCVILGFCITTIIIMFLIGMIVYINSPKTVYKYKSDIKVGTEITYDMIEEIEINSDLFKDGMIKNPNNIVGKITKQDINKDTIVYSNQLYTLSDYIGNIEFSLPSTISLNKDNNFITFKNINKNINLVFEIYYNNEVLGSTECLLFNKEQSIELYSLLEKGENNINIKIYTYQKNGQLYKEFNKKITILVDETNENNETILELNKTIDETKDSLNNVLSLCLNFLRIISSIIIIFAISQLIIAKDEEIRFTSFKLIITSIGMIVFSFLFKYLLIFL